MPLKIDGKKIDTAPALKAAGIDNNGPFKKQLSKKEMRSMEMDTAKKLIDNLELKPVESISNFKTSEYVSAQTSNNGNKVINPKKRADKKEAIKHYLWIACIIKTITTYI